MRNFILPLAAVIAFTGYAQESSSTTNVGIEQLSVISPAPGSTLSSETHSFGFQSIELNFKGSQIGDTGMTANVNRNADLFVTLKRNGEVVSNVPASNTAQIKFDNTMFNNWSITFFPKTCYEGQAGGQYQVIIPEGFFLIGNEQTPNSEIIINYTYTLDPISYYPDQSGSYTELKDFVITFGNATKVELSPDAAPLQMANMYGEGYDEEAGEEDPNTYYDFTVTCNGNAAYLTLNAAITSPGLWFTDIPADYFKLTDENNKVTSTGEILLRYRIPTVTEEDQPTADPAPGDIPFFPGVIELEIAEDQTLMLPNDMGMNVIVALNEDGTQGATIADYRAASKSSKYYYESDENGKIDKTKPIASSKNKIFLVNRMGDETYLYPAPGQYMLCTTNSLYTFTKNNKIQSSPAFTYIYNVVPSELFNMEFTPSTEEPIPSLKEIIVTFPTADEVIVNFATATFNSATTNYLFYPRKSEEYPKSVIFSTGVPVTMPGKYRLTADSKSVCINGEYVSVVADYTIGENTGVECIGNVQVLPEVFDIYNAQGILVYKNANVEILNALPAGIYIAGGKKFINR